MLDNKRISFFLTRIQFTSFILLFSLLLPNSVEAITATKKQILQKETTPIQSPEKQKAYEMAMKRLYSAQQLTRERSVEARTRALGMYEEVLKVMRQIPNRQGEALTLFSMGSLYNTQNEPQKALEYFNQSLTIHRELKIQLLQAYDLFSLGIAYSSLGEQQKALDNYNQALVIFRAQKERSQEASTLGSIGQTYISLGKPQKALEFYNQALVIYKSEGNRGNVARTLELIGAAYSSVGEIKKVVASLEEAILIYRELKKPIAEASTLSSIGVYLLSNDPQKARDYQNKALALIRANGGNSLEQAKILWDIAGTYMYLGDYPKRLEILNQALPLYQEAAYPMGEVLTLQQISSSYDSLGEKQKALEALNRALTITRRIKSRSYEAETLRLMAGIYSYWGKSQEALDTYNQALTLQRAIGDRVEEARTLNNIGSLYKSLGAYQLSIDTFNQSLSLSRQVQDANLESLNLYNIATVYESLGNYQQSLNYYNQGLLQSRQRENRVYEGMMLSGIADTYEASGDYQKALDASSKVLSVARADNNTVFEITALASIGRIYRQKGEYQKALESFNQGLLVSQKIKNPFLEAKVLTNTGKVFDRLKQPQEAINNYNRALPLYRVLGERKLEADTLYNIAVSERSRGNFEAARTQIEATINIIEDLRTKVDSQELRTSYFATTQDYYKFYIDLLMQLHKQNPSKGYNAIALNASEKSRARGLLELLTEAKAKIRKGANPELLEKESDLFQQIEARQALLQKLKSETKKDAVVVSIKKLEAETENLLNQYRELQANIQKSNPKYANLKYPQPLNLQQIQQQLDKDTLLLQYSLGEERSYLWAVTPNSLTTYELPGRKAIKTAVENFRDAIIRAGTPYGKDHPDDINKSASQLSQLILAPVAAKLPGKRLVIVADGALQTIPFAALTATSGQYQPLMLNHEIVSLPSSSAIAIQRQELAGRKIAPKAIAILADPVYSATDTRVTGKPENNQLAPELKLERSTLDRSSKNFKREGFDRLQGTEAEAKAILKLIPAANTQQAFNFDANYNWVTNPGLNQFRILHFATHGFVNPDNPELSGIVLSLVDKKGKPIRGFLRLGDLFNLDYPAELVVLSACETGLGKEVNGEGLVGLTRGLMYAGAARVMVSLWQVNDEGTSLLMQEFYQQMLQQNKTPAVALRAAQMKLWENPKWRNPYYWSAFTVQGEWR
jgi:CHAT domain-containing protein/tetratricopeptide (TPR) repeat protein